MQPHVVRTAGAERQPVVFGGTTSHPHFQAAPGPEPAKPRAHCTAAFGRPFARRRGPRFRRRRRRGQVAVADGRPDDCLLSRQRLPALALRTEMFRQTLSRLTRLAPAAEVDVGVLAKGFLRIERYADGGALRLVHVGHLHGHTPVRGPQAMQMSQDQLAISTARLGVGGPRQLPLQRRHPILGLPQFRPQDAGGGIPPGDESPVRLRIVEPAVRRILKTLEPVHGPVAAQPQRAGAETEIPPGIQAVFIGQPRVPCVQDGTR